MNPPGRHRRRGLALNLLPVFLLASLFFPRCLAVAAEPGVSEKAGRSAVALEALSRLQGLDLEANPTVKAAVMKVIESAKGTPQFVELIRDFRIKDQNPALLDFAIKHPNESAGVEAMRLILAQRDLDLLRLSLQGGAALNVVEALGNTSGKQIVPLLEPIVLDTSRDTALRRQAVRALAQTQDGAMVLLKLAKEEKLPADLRFVAGAELNKARWPQIKADAARFLPLPGGQSAQLLPPAAELLKMKGNPANGAQVFQRETVGCNQCHEVNGQGVDFGPNLSEIGTKLGKEAFYEAILNPSAGIAFGFEAWQIDLKNGDEAYGLIVSETADEIAVKAQTGIVTRCKKSDVAKREQLKTSIMPAGLQLTMPTQDLADLVEYLASLKKAAVP